MKNTILKPQKHKKTALSTLLLSMFLGVLAPTLATAQTNVPSVNYERNIISTYVQDNGLNDPNAIAMDSHGNLYVADTNNHVIKKIDATTQVITIVAGISGTANYSGDEGAATAATLNSPYGIAFDSNDNLYIADLNNNRIRKVDAAGVITTVVGTGQGAFGGDDGLATEAQIKNPYAIAFDSNDNLYIGDTSNYRLRKVDVTTHLITTMAGNGGQYSNGVGDGDGGLATEAAIGTPDSIVLDNAGNLYFSAYAGGGGVNIRKVDTATGVIITIAPGNTPNATGITFNSNGDLYFSETGNHKVKRLDTAGGIATIAGGNGAEYSGDDKEARNAQLNSPQSTVFDSAGNLYVLDRVNKAIRKITFGTAALTMAAIANTATSVSGTAGANDKVLVTLTNGITSTVAADADGNWAVADLTPTQLTVGGQVKAEVVLNSGASISAQVTRTVGETTHTVTYSLNGGTGTLPTQTEVGENATFTAAASTGLTKPSYTFAGWSDGTNTYQAGATITMGTADLTLTAQWTATLGIADSAYANLAVFPNPCKDLLQLQSLGQEVYTYSLFDITGKLILSGGATENHSIDTSVLPKGVYVLSVITEGKTQNIKVVKE